MIVFECICEIEISTVETYLTGYMCILHNKLQRTDLSVIAEYI